MKEKYQADNTTKKNFPIIDEGVFPSVFENSGEERRKEIELIITMGGDGTILWASK